MPALFNRIATSSAADSVHPSNRKLHEPEFSLVDSHEVCTLYLDGSLAAGARKLWVKEDSAVHLTRLAFFFHPSFKSNDLLNGNRNHGSGLGSANCVSEHFVSDTVRKTEGSAFPLTHTHPVGLLWQLPFMQR